MMVAKGLVTVGVITVLCPSASIQREKPKPKSTSAGQMGNPGRVPPSNRPLKTGLTGISA